MSTISLARRDYGKENKVALHFLQAHRGCPEDFQVVGIDKIKTNIQGRDTLSSLLRSEARWIHSLQSISLKGLNVELLFTGYYKK